VLLIGWNFLSFLFLSQDKQATEYDKREKIGYKPVVADE